VQDGYLLYDSYADYARLQLTTEKAFKLCRLNESFTLCDSYPPLLVLPAVLSDKEIKAIAEHRSKGRLPVVVWMHPVTRATLSRCAQPLVGLKGKRSETDEKLFEILRELNPVNSEVLHIIDARPYKAAMG
jgi:myotubularin-related protein 1/2